MRALLLFQLVFGNSRAQSGDGSSSGNTRVTTSFDIVTETKITYRPDLLDTSTPAYSAEKDRVVDETRPGFEAAAARTGATLISVDVLFSISSSSFSARRRRYFSFSSFSFKLIQDKQRKQSSPKSRQHFRLLRRTPMFLNLRFHPSQKQNKK